MGSLRFEPVSEELFRVAFAETFAPPGGLDDGPIPCVATMSSPVGPLLLAATARGLCTLEFLERASLERRLRALHRKLAGRAVLASNDVLDSVREQLRAYFAGELTRFEVALDYTGTPFQQKVWSMLLEIPYGVTWSYLDVAERLGDAGATRAVGMANGANPIAIVIPCHRVVNASGELGGYGGGSGRKRILLDLEKGQGQLPL